ncbi:rab-GTPase-TBC domain-containing protein [Neurospora intermedia]|uniref:Rab-GTPase-TBC domain-containing protein n=1 Tax=Neurospora intermedia TaxID=5142 RepID=A0ABR3DLX8_NEUIN
MKPLSEAKSRWEETMRYSSKPSSYADLQQAIKHHPQDSPCLAGCRSVCWKMLLVFRDSPTEKWGDILSGCRSSYASIHEKHLRFIRHPELLAKLPVDPLADDADSPWELVRRDELTRSEILQDVQRLPDDPLYHQDSVQAMILDILFLYCKLNPGVGGYRQGMHELLAPIVHVLVQDALDRKAVAADEEVGPLMLDMLDSAYVEHDAYTIFSILMARASAFYEVGSDANGEQNTIVEKSRHIHDELLMQVDPELASHLKEIEILPQIFLIRWIRLLFGREFPFEQLLVLWDTIFALDPNLDLIDLVCVAMLLRIRWTLLECDYAMALQLLLRYPVPPDSHGPHTFVDDALYLRDHPNPTGGATVIFKHTGKHPLSSSAAPSVPSPGPQPPASPSKHGFGSLRQRTLGARSPLSSLQQPGGVEALLSGAAKNMIERGEKLGINRAVRDAMGEIKKGLQEARSSSRSTAPRSPLRDGYLYQLPQHTVTSMQKRNRQLATMLDESVTSLKQLAASGLGETTDKEKYVEAVEIAAAKVQFVKACLEDSSLILDSLEESAPEREPQTPSSPTPSAPAFNALSLSPSRHRGNTDSRSPTVALDITPVVMTSSIVEGEAEAGVSISQASTIGTLPPAPAPAPESTVEADEPPKTPTEMTTTPENTISKPKTSNGNDPSSSPAGIHKPPASPPSANPIEPTLSSPPTHPDPVSSSSPSQSETREQQQQQQEQQQDQQEQPPHRPEPLPTRSTIAQSSFAWMLEPDSPSFSAPNSSSTQQHYTKNTFPPPRSPTTAFPELGGRGRPSGSHTSSHPITGTGGGAKTKPRKKSLGKSSRMSNASRERNAFLFGDDDEDGDGQAAGGGGGGGGGGKKSGLAMGPLGDGIFGLEVISRSKDRQQEKDGGKEGDGVKGEEGVEEER